MGNNGASRGNTGDEKKVSKTGDQLELQSYQKHLNFVDSGYAPGCVRTPEQQRFCLSYSEALVQHIALNRQREVLTAFAMANVSFSMCCLIASLTINVYDWFLMPWSHWAQAFQVFFVGPFFLFMIFQGWVPANKWPGKLIHIVAKGYTDKQHYAAVFAGGSEDEREEQDAGSPHNIQPRHQPLWTSQQRAEFLTYLRSTEIPLKILVFDVSAGGAAEVIFGLLTVAFLIW